MPKTRIEAITEIIEGMYSDQFVSLHNAYCDATNHMDDYIYSMDDFDEIMSGQTPWEIARTCYYGDFCPAHNYFWFNGYANACSSDYPTGQISVDEIAAYIDETGDDLGDSEIAALLEDMEAENEE